MTARILIVDDREENLYLLSTLLTGHGYIVEVAADGAQALTAARSAPPDLVVSDLLMPVMDGYTLLRNWREDPQLRSIGFVVYTATFTSAEDEKLALEIGADAFLLKPSEPDVLLAVVKRLLQEPSPYSALVGSRPDWDDIAVQKRYSAALFRKLESRMLELEAGNTVIQRTNSQLETLVSQAPIGILVHRNFEPLVANNAFARIFGWADRGHVIALAECGHLFDEEEHARIIACQNGEPGDYRRTDIIATKGKHISGGMLDIEIRAFPIEWTGQNAVCMMVTDVTSQRATEAALRQSQRIDAIGQLTGGVAHDFNNLLTVVIGSSETLFDQAESPGQRELAALILQAAEQASSLTRQLLAFSRRQPLAPQPFDINALITQNMALIRRTLGAQIEIVVNLMAEIEPVYADPAQTAAALLNLCINARDAMPEGGRLTITGESRRLTEDFCETHPGARLGNYAMIVVTDNGTGIAPDIIDRVFDPFFTTKDAGRGTGLGLSMVYGFVKQSAGYIDLRSDVGAGSSFTLYLPIAPADAVAAPLPVGEAPEEQGGSETILLVEDNALVRTHVKSLCEGLGYGIVTAGSGVEAMQILESRNDIDLVFTDVVMPGGLNGQELGERARARWPSLRILLTSGYAHDALVGEGRAMTGAKLLTKPYSKRQLARRIRQVLDEVP
ncbi:MAG: response regulator [Pseudomonadota bacterium]